MKANERLLVDDGLAVLIEVGAATAANGERYLIETLERLRAAGVPDERIRGAVEIGEAVKSRPAAVMKEAADVLTGTRLSPPPESGGCPAEGMPRGDAFLATMLIAAGAAMAANCEPCLNQAVPALIEAGVADADMQRAVSIGQAVKDRVAGDARAALQSLSEAA